MSTLRQIEEDVKEFLDKETKIFVRNINEIFEKKQEELDFYRKELEKYKNREYDDLYS